jgi:hypothetical protein
VSLYLLPIDLHLRSIGHLSRSIGHLFKWHAEDSLAPWLGRELVEVRPSRHLLRHLTALQRMRARPIEVFLTKGCFLLCAMHMLQILRTLQKVSRPRPQYREPRTPSDVLSCHAHVRRLDKDAAGALTLRITGDVNASRTMRRRSKGANKERNIGRAKRGPVE